jgi:lycopene cyclase domain-containing protein
MTYTVLVVFAVLGALVLDLAVLRTRLVRRRAFWTAYTIVLFFQLLTNGWLTGRDIVVYSADDILGARFVYAPVEDLLFGFSMVLQTQAWWVWWGRRFTGAEASQVASRGAPVEP